MMKKKILILLCLCIPILLLFGSALGVTADSGFDVGYDSGSSSSDSGSSWGWSSSGGSYSSDGSAILVVLLVFVIVIIIKSSEENKKIDNDYYEPISDEIARKLIPNFNSEEFINSRYEDFVAIQNAWMNFDYDVLRNKLTDELYNQYIFQLDSMKIKRTQNIMKDFNFINGKVISVKKNDHTFAVKIELIVSFIDFIEEDGKAIRGSNKESVNVRYIMTFVRSDGSEIDRCPNCGSKLNDASSQTCEYCRSIITRTGSDWVLAKKENKKQW